MKSEIQRLDQICELLWEEKSSWKMEIENYMKELSVIFEKFIRLIHIGEIKEYTAEDVFEQIQRLMIGLEHRDNMYIADILVGETREVLERLYNEDE